MKRGTRTYRLLGLALALSFVLGAAAPLVTCANAATAGMPGHTMPHEAPCMAPCCALKAPSGDEAPAPPLAGRELFEPSGLSLAPSLSQGAAAFVRAVEAARHDAAGTDDPPLRPRPDAAEEPTTAVGLHVLHATFLN